MKLNPPVIIASGPAGNGEYAKFLNPEFVGAYTLKTITYKKKDGNKPPRLYCTQNYMINRIGLENPGIFEFIDELERGNFDELFKNFKVVLSLGADSAQEYVEVTRAIKPYLDRFVAVEYNFSCPNVEHGGLSIIADIEKWKNVLKEIRNLTDSFIVAKLGIEGHFIEHSAKIVEQMRWNGITAINTIRGLAFTSEGFILGGLSGPILKPIALRNVYEIRKACPDIYIIASGGIYSLEDAKQFLNVGANAISVGTAIFTDEKIVEQIGRELKV